MNWEADMTAEANQMTITCEECGWTTDIELTSATNPTMCPKCQGALVDAYTGEPIDRKETK